MNTRVNDQRSPRVRVSTARPGDRWYHGVAYLLPGFLIYSLFVLYPAASTLWYSLHEWSGIGQATWIGFANYRRLIEDPLFWTALVNNIQFLAFYTVIPILIGLILAAILNQSWLRGATTYRMLLFLPQILPAALIGVIWRWIYNPAFGPLNKFLESVGLGGLAKPWLGDFNLALPSVGLVASWYFYGFCMAVFVAGIQKIEPSLYDAAKIDGANSSQQFWHVTLPGLRHEIAVVLIFTFVAALKVFDLVFVTTRGGPGNETLVASLYLYRNAFQQSAVGYGATVAVAITLLVVVAAVILRRFQEAME